MSDDDLTAAVRDALDPTPASEADWPVSRRDTLRALAGVGALAVGPGGAQGAAGTGIADAAYFSNYGWESTAEGGVLTIDGAEFAFDGSEAVALPDGSEASTVVLPDGREASTVVGPGGGVLKEFGIPDNVVSRPDDTGVATDQTNSIGLVINPNSDFSAVGTRISSQTANATRARLFDYSSGTYERTVDISALSANDAFAFDYALRAGTDYGIEIDAEGGNWDAGFNSESNYPYTGADIDIVSRSQNGAKDDAAGVSAVNDIGNPDKIL